jgi:hypothetical protein
MSEEKFQEEYIAVYCAWATDCGWFADDAECGEVYADWRADREDCAYDGVAAKDCVNGTEELACPASEQEPQELPLACSSVYTCEGT